MWRHFIKCQETYPGDLPSQSQSHVDEDLVGQIYIIHLSSFKHSADRLEFHWVTSRARGNWVVSLIKHCGSCSWTAVFVSAVLQSPYCSWSPVFPTHCCLEGCLCRWHCGWRSLLVPLSQGLADGSPEARSPLGDDRSSSASLHLWQMHIHKDLSSCCASHLPATVLLGQAIHYPLEMLLQHSITAITHVITL